MTSLKQHPPMRFVALAFVWASVLLIPTFAPAQDWKVQVGAQSKDKALQVIAFLPNEIWIHVGDSIAFKVATDEPHTVTFLTANQVVPPFSVGCPGSTPNGAPEDGSNCVNSGTLTNGQSYSVTFPEPGDYKLICLYHQNHTAVIHVLQRHQGLQNHGVRRAEGQIGAMPLHRAAYQCDCHIFFAPRSP